MRLILRAAVGAALVLSACKTTEPAPQPPPAEAPPPASAEPKRLIDESKPMPGGIDSAAMDLTVNPCDDFYQYACGGWLKSTEIPADRAAWSRGFAMIAERNEKLLRDILVDTAAKKAPEGTPYAKQLGDFWSTCMDEPRLENGLKDLKKETARIAKVKDAKSLTTAVAWMHEAGMTPLFRFGSTPDLKKPDQVIAEFTQGGLGLPDRDYYVQQQDPKKQEVLKNYRQHVAKMFELYGDKPELAQQKAERVVALETELAKVSLTRVEQRDPTRLYNKLDRKGLVEKAPHFGWAAFLSGVGLAKVNDINVTHPPFFEHISTLAQKAGAPEVRDYLTWVMIRESVPALPKAFADEAFRFQSQNITGAKEDLPRWKKCVAWTDTALGEALAVPFVKMYFGEEGKKTTNAMVQEIEKAFENNLDGLAWMDAETKQRALKKLHAITNKIGYPDKWKKYDTFRSTPKSFLANVIEAGRFEAARDLEKIGKPVDKTEWFMSPPTVNAYYNPTFNEIVFPAGILQPPFFDIRAEDAVNFGAMGMVVGHEITHGFDDEGRQFDWDGSLTDWWTEASGKAFTQRAECVKDRYSNETAIDDLKVNGELTLGENIADIGGLKLSHMAMRQWIAKEPGRDGEPKFRYNDDQQFFLGYAQSWCSKYRPENARMRVTVDPHSPPFLRVNVPLSNMPAFQKAFGCSVGSPMAMTQEKRCEVW